MSLSAFTTVSLYFRDVTNVNKEHTIEAVARSSLKKVALKILQNSQENTCARPATLLKRLWRRCFPVNFAKFLRTLFLI